MLYKVGNREFWCCSLSVRKFPVVTAHSYRQPLLDFCCSWYAIYTKSHSMPIKFLLCCQQMLDHFPSVRSLCVLQGSYQFPSLCSLSQSKQIQLLKPFSTHHIFLSLIPFFLLSFWHSLIHTFQKIWGPKWNTIYRIFLPGAEEGRIAPIADPKMKLVLFNAWLQTLMLLHSCHLAGYSS